MHNANDNAQLLLDDAAVAVERYGPYGERTVYTSPGSRDHPPANGSVIEPIDPAAP